MSLFIVFDVGGTRMRVSSSSDGITFLEPKVVSTPTQGKDGIHELITLITEVSGGQKITAISGGLPGIIDVEKGSLSRSPHLFSWVGESIRDQISNVFGAPVFIENDTALVGLGEAVSGAGEGKRIVAYVTVSTGVGGVRIINGKIDESSSGFEPGHQIINSSKMESLEELVSGSSFEKRFGKKPIEVTDSTVWQEGARNLAVGLHNTILHWSPDVVVLGGPMVLGEPRISIGDVRKNLKEIMKVFDTVPPIVEATLGNFGGLHGALALIKSQM